ncbi:MAG TPA: glycosyltransferase family 4 protein, partial [Longimicrobiales bacterium]|nr:glycosyltransferase family 4 protein [Longimicrobiales bacterium]
MALSGNIQGTPGTGPGATGFPPGPPPLEPPETTLDPRPSLLQVCVWARLGGAERIALRLLRSLDDAYRVALGLVRPLPPARRTLAWEGRSVGLREVLFGPWDVIHTHLFLPGLLIRLRRLWDGSFRWVHTVHYQGYEHLSLGRLRRWLDHRVVFPHADALVAVSPGVRDALSERFPRVELVENAVDLSPPAEGRVPTETPEGTPGARPGPAGAPRPHDESAAGGPVVGTVSMLRAEKGVDDLLRAVRALLERHPGLRVRIAGDGPERERLERTAGELGVGSAVEFCGFVDDLAPFYRSLDAYVQPSRTETFGLAVLDALRHGTPVVAARVGHLPDLLDGGRFGALVDRDGRFPERLSRSVADVLEARDDYRRRALEGAAHWRARLDPGRMVAAYRDLYAGVLRPRVCMIQPVVTHAGGGLARQLLLQSRELARRGHRVHLIQRRDPWLETDPERRAR